MKRPVLLAMATMIVMSGSVISQQAPSQKDIDAAIEKGTNFLLNNHSKGVPADRQEFELIVYTLIHAELDPRKTVPLKQGIDDLINHVYPVKDARKGLDQRLTYRIAIRCLALHSLLVKIRNNTYFRHLQDKIPVIQKKIAESAQYLVDTQLDNGQWTYSGELKNAPEVSNLVTGGPRPENPFNDTAGKIAWENASGLTGTLYKLIPKYGADAKDKKTDLGKPVEPGKQRGDNSSTQYGILGLIAAEMSGVEVPRTTWALVQKWFESTQNSDGGFGYTKEGGPEIASYGGMTVVGAVALAASYKYLGKDFKNEKRYQNALNWLAANFSVTEHPKAPPAFKTEYHYYMYGLERVGAFSGSRTLGTHDWYAEGAAQLLKRQRQDGSWPGPEVYKFVDPCFAILFLKRATTDMIDSGGGR